VYELYNNNNNNNNSVLFFDSQCRVRIVSRGVVCVILLLAVLTQYRLVTDRRTHDDSIHRASIAPLKLRLYGAKQICLLLLLLLLFDTGTQFPGNEKITLCNTKKYKNQAGMNLTSPPPSQNSHAVR